MPVQGVVLKPHGDILSFEEITELVSVAVSLGVNKVRLTGGEPLVRRDIIDLVHRISAIPGIDDFSMTTNGVLLPKFAVRLKAAGIHRLNISLDTLDPEKFRIITRIGSLADTLAGIEAACSTEFSKIKLNCVISSSPDEPDARAVSEFGRKKNLEVRFIRKMTPSTGEFWQVLGGDGGNCANCNRLRVSSDGHIFPCLFSDLKYSVRELGPKGALLAAVEAKPEAGHLSNNKFYMIGG
jgi:cyclic pyranopterin phosphate synthase